MPVRNGRRWIAEAVESVLSQSMPNLELLIVDDGSTDDTPGILENYRHRDARIRVFTQKPAGLVAALNFGLSQASAGIVARLDADDIAEPGRLQRQADYMDENPEVALLGTWATSIDEYGRTIGRMEPRPHELGERLRTGNPFIHSSVAFRADLARGAGWYRPAFEAAEDYDFWLRLSEQGSTVILPEMHVRYRVHPDSISSQKTVRQHFSMRLAQRAAVYRSKGLADPTSTLATAPNWTETKPDEFYFAEARLARFLSLAGAGSECAGAIDDADLGALNGLALTHKERKLAQIAILRILKRPSLSPADKRRLEWTLFRLHPLRALRLLSQRLRS